MPLGECSTDGRYGEPACDNWVFVDVRTVIQVRKAVSDGTIENQSNSQNNRIHNALIKRLSLLAAGGNPCDGSDENSRDCRLEG